MALSKMNQHKLLDITKTKWDMIGIYQEAGIIPMTKKCDNGHEMHLDMGDAAKEDNNTKRDRWRCKSRKCRNDIGVQTGTWLEGSRLGLDKILWFIYNWSRDRSSIKECQTEQNMNPSTATDYNNYMREICAWFLMSKQKKIGGKNMIVEIDESMFTRRNSNKGRVLPRQWVFGGICRETKEVFMCLVDDRTSTTLMTKIKEFIEPETTIYSDCWSAYKALEMDKEYNHRTVNHSYNFVDPDDGTHTDN